jgi:hypothetical protein
MMQHLRFENLKKMFELEKEKIIVTLIKIKQYPHLVKKLKKMHEDERNALLERYFHKCKIAQCERFFSWRTKYLKLESQQRIMIDSQIAEMYQRNEDFNNNNVESLKDVGVPPQLGLKPEEVANFQKVVALVYPQKQSSLAIERGKSTFFMT